MHGLFKTFKNILVKFQDLHRLCLTTTIEPEEETSSSFKGQKFFTNSIIIIDGQPVRFKRHFLLSTFILIRYKGNYMINYLWLKL